MKAAGFTKLGVSAASLAAAIQSKIYGGIIAKTAIFAKLQSLGALGIYDPTLLSFLLLTGCGIYFYYWFRNTANSAE